MKVMQKEMEVLSLKANLSPTVAIVPNDQNDPELGPGLAARLKAMKEELEDLASKANSSSMSPPQQPSSSTSDASEDLPPETKAFMAALMNGFHENNVKMLELQGQAPQWSQVPRNKTEEIPIFYGLTARSMLASKQSSQM